MRVLVTGSAGFIGFHLVKALLAKGNHVTGIDNLNDYYSTSLKRARLQAINDSASSHKRQNNYCFKSVDLADREQMKALFEEHKFDAVVNLAAQAGVRYSIDNPSAYVDSNLVGFANLLEGCRDSNIKHLVFASSSSVYGMNCKQPFSTNDQVDYPISLYAATKKANELMAHSYSHLFDIPMTGLRFFTVYGPWGRPDMAYFKFTKAILEDKPIDVYNRGEMVRDFTYIDDIVEGIGKIIDRPTAKQKNDITRAQAPFKIYNIGNNRPIKLRRFISALEASCNKKAIENLLPMQPGDVPLTYADIDPLVADFDFMPATEIEDGIERFVQWYLNHKA